MTIILGKGSSVGGGFTLSPNPPVEGLNLFTAATEGETETLRDNYFSANPTDLVTYDNNAQKIIAVVYDGLQFFQNRALGSWVDTFNSASSAVDLSAHSVTDLGDVASAGSGQIITDAERLSITSSEGRLGELNNVDNTSDEDKPVSTPQAAALALKAPNTSTFPLSNQNSAVYADGAPGRQSPYGELGWYYKNDVGYSQKINWYFYGQGLSSSETLGDITSAYCVVTTRTTGELPFFVTYTYPEGDSNDAQPWYRSRIVYSSQVATIPGETYLLYFGEEPDVFPTLPRVQLSKDGSSEGPEGGGEVIFTSSLQSNSAATPGDVEFTCRVISFSTHVKNVYLLSAVTQSTIDSDVSWMLSTDVFTAPTIAYPSVLVDVNSSGQINPVILSGTSPVNAWNVSSGSLPSEFTLNQETGTITYTTTAITSSGSATIVASNPAGDSAGYVINWGIREAQGAAEFLNTLNEYPFMRVTTSNSIDSQVLVKQQFHGRTSSTSNGTIIEDPVYPIYAASNGDGTWNYLLHPQGYSYWNLYVNCSTDPTTLSHGIASDITTSQAGAYNLVAQASNDVTVNGINYPSDRSDIHWGSGLRFINFGHDTSLDGFMTDAGSWSYGFKLEDDWPDDGMGRGLFTRDGRNWLAVALGHSGTYSEMIYGNGSSRSYDSQEITSIPSGGFSAGSFVRFTFTGSIISMYVDGVKYYDYPVAAHWDGSSANVLDVQFSNGVSANYDFGITAYNYTKWQGLISRLWIANGTLISSDDDGITYPIGTTHAWDLNEVTGSEFSPSIGSVSGSGMNEV
ncbi:conserved hypothetical protein [Vibrio phage 249E41-1]|nr:conserved hypothetical protein [Vibrio phage 249E41-1]CAH9015877.1 conserved hypothetical protein [Vibrio phage 193E37-1]